MALLDRLRPKQPRSSIMATTRHDADNEESAIHSLGNAAADVTNEVIKLLGAFCRSGTELAVGSVRVLADTVIDIDHAIYRGARGVYRDRDEREHDTSYTADRVGGSVLGNRESVAPRGGRSGQGSPADRRGIPIRGF